MTAREYRHPRHSLDDVLQSSVRLSLVAALSGVEKADFRTLRDTVEVSDSALSKQLATLEDASYVEIGKERAGRHARTWAWLTEEGAAAFQRHMEALHAIAGLRVLADEDGHQI